jgi:hypothetical protein
MLDVETCAMAFRVLRMNAYDVSSGTSTGRAFHTFTALITQMKV